MVQAFFNGLLKFFLFIANLIGTIFIYPLQALVVTLVPSVADYLSDISDFFTNSVFPTICFLKRLFLNVTCCPPVLFSLLVSTFFGFLTIALVFRVFVLLYRIYFLVRGTKV